MRLLAALGPAVLLVACSSSVTGSPAPTSTAAPTPTPAAAGVIVGGGCDLLEPAQVEQITGRSGVSEAASGLDQTGDFQGCFYDVPELIFLTVSYARGFEGTDGQALAERGAERVGPFEPVSGIGAGAVWTPGTDGQASVVAAYPDARGGLLTVTVQGALPREQLEALARQVDENL